ncbi:MAG: YfhO family protein [Acidobacteriota bacterium]
MNKTATTNRRVHLMNIAFIVLVVVALYWQVFFLGKTIIDVDTLNNQLPWGYAANEKVNHPYNRRDPTDMYLTREYFIVGAYRNGELPLWNPYTFAGHPIYADGVTRIFSPTLLVYTFLDLPVGYSVARLLELILGAIFMYLFLIAIGVSARGALAGALVFELSAHSLFHLTGLGWWGGLMWLPLIFLFVDRAITRNNFKYAILAGVFVALQFYSAYMPNQIYYLGAVTLYYLVFGRKVKRRTHTDFVASLTTKRLALMLAVTLAVGFLLSASQWIPVMELLQASNRRIVPVQTSFIYLPPWYLLTLIFPNLFGTAYDPQFVNLFTALNVSHDHSLYLSIAALLPLGFLFYSTWKKRRDAKGQNQEATNLSFKEQRSKNLDAVEAVDSQVPVDDYLHQQRIAFFIFLIIFAIFVMMVAPLYVHLTRFIPVLQTIRVIVRAGVLFIFAAAVLVAFGFDRLLNTPRETFTGFFRLAGKFVIAVYGFAGLAISVFYLFKLTGWLGNTSAEYSAGSGKLAYMKSVIAAMSSQFAPPNLNILLPLGFLLLVYLLSRLWIQGQLNRNYFYWSLMIFLVVELAINSWQYDKAHDAARVFPKTAITEKLKTLPPGRVLITPSGIESNRRAHLSEEKVIAPPNTLLAYQIPSVTGKDQLFPKAYREFCSLIEPQDRLSHVVFDETTSPFFDALNVRYVITYESATPPLNHQLIMKAEGVALYENLNALARAYFVKSVTSQNGLKAVLPERLRQSDFDIKSEAVIGEGNALPQNFSVGEAQIIEDRRNRVVIETENAGEGILILSDTYYPGWQATIDGNAVEIFRANHAMRAVRVPAGRHVVSFSFAPKPFTTSIYLSLTTLFMVLAILIFMQINQQKKIRNPQ